MGHSNNFGSKTFQNEEYFLSTPSRSRQKGQALFSGQEANQEHHICVEAALGLNSSSVT